MPLRSGIVPDRVTDEFADSLGKPQMCRCAGFFGGYPLPAQPRWGYGLTPAGVTGMRPLLVAAFHRSAIGGETPPSASAPGFCSRCGDAESRTTARKRGVSHQRLQRARPIGVNKKPIVWFPRKVTPRICPRSLIFMGKLGCISGPFRGK